jgi:ankyrin repeat protein
MHPEISEQLERFKDSRLSHIQTTQDYDEMKKSLVDTEVMLGHAETQYQEDNEDHEGYIEALEEIWGDACTLAVRKAVSFAEDSMSFRADLRLTPDGMVSALHDNYLFGAIAAVLAAIDDQSARQLPLLPAAAFNKHTYQGYHDEIACLRFLLWAGFDPDATDSAGRTALHFMASMQNLPWSHPRAVRLLLAAGADPNLQNKNGDTAFCYMSGNADWSSQLTETAWVLLNNGANPMIPAKDGESAYTLLKKKTGNPQVSQLVETIENILAAGREGRE